MFLKCISKRCCAETKYKADGEHAFKADGGFCDDDDHYAKKAADGEDGIHIAIDLGATEHAKLRDCQCWQHGCECAITHKRETAC